MSSPSVNVLGSQQWPVGYHQVPKFALSQTDSTHIAMAQVVVDFAGKQLTYNARIFVITTYSLDPGTPYAVTIYDPALVGDLPGQTNLQAFCLNDSTQNGKPGYVYIGSVVAWVDPNKAYVGPGGWMPGSGYTPADPNLSVPLPWPKAPYVPVP